jgi:AraC-like DNA-binding protein
MAENTDAIQRWSTADVAQARRLDYFASALSEAVYPLGIDRADPTTFNADVSFAHLGSIGVCKTIGSAHHSRRGQSELARTADHSYVLLMTMLTSWGADHRGPLHLSPRDVLIIDSEYPLKTVINGPFTSLAVAVSEAWLRQWIPNPHVLAARQISGNSPWGHALSAYVSQLSPDLAAAPPLPLTVLADQVGSLLALTASGMQAATFRNTPAVCSLRERIEDCVSQRCTEWQLTAVDVAASLNISVRTLHRSFAAANETFGGALIEARAHVALRMLTSPLFNRLTTAEIGRRAGFPSASHFARVIRTRTGRTPLQLRRAVHPEVLGRETFAGVELPPQS